MTLTCEGAGRNLGLCEEHFKLLQKDYSHHFTSTVKTNECSPDAGHFCSASFKIIFVLFLYVWSFFFPPMADLKIDLKDSLTGTSTIVIIYIFICQLKTHFQFRMFEC